ncbi:MAG: hypothetical protein ACTSVV_13465 [Promethearchaeota archaeon]
MISNYFKEFKNCEFFIINHDPRGEIEKSLIFLTFSSLNELKSSTLEHFPNYFNIYEEIIDSIYDFSEKYYEIKEKLNDPNILMMNDKFKINIFKKINEIYQDLLNLQFLLMNELFLIMHGYIRLKNNDDIIGIQLFSNSLIHLMLLFISLFSFKEISRSEINDFFKDTNPYIKWFFNNLLSYEEIHKFDLLNGNKVLKIRLKEGKNPIDAIKNSLIQKFNNDEKQISNVYKYYKKLNKNLLSVRNRSVLSHGLFRIESTSIIRAKILNSFIQLLEITINNFNDYLSIENNSLVDRIINTFYFTNIKDDELDIITEMKYHQGSFVDILNKILNFGSVERFFDSFIDLIKQVHLSAL